MEFPASLLSMARFIAVVTPYPQFLIHPAWLRYDQLAFASKTVKLSIDPSANFFLNMTLLWFSSLLTSENTTPIGEKGRQDNYSSSLVTKLHNQTNQKFKKPITFHYFLVMIAILKALPIIIVEQIPGLL